MHDLNMLLTIINYVLVTNGRSELVLYTHDDGGRDVYEYDEGTPEGLSVQVICYTSSIGKPSAWVNVDVPGHRIHEDLWAMPLADINDVGIRATFTDRLTLLTK